MPAIPSAKVELVHYSWFRVPTFKMLIRVQVSAELGSSYSDVMSVQDVALYGSLCSLASCDRQELKRTIIENFRYREVLSTTPEVCCSIDSMQQSMLPSSA